MSYAPLVLMGRNRVYHVCRLGSRLDDRIIGAFVIYCGLEHDVTVHFAGSDVCIGRIVVVEPYRRHRIAAGRHYVCTILIEPESVADAQLGTLMSELTARRDDPGALGDLFMLLRDILCNPEAGHRIDEAEIDRMIFRCTPEARPLDRRIDHIADLLERDLEANADIDSYAREVLLSASRFRRLFRESTGVSFRNYRMWKRARAYLNYVNAPAPLTQTALELGYSDSTHFSHSIRQTYGIAPREMRMRMRDSLFVPVHRSVGG